MEDSTFNQVYGPLDSLIYPHSSKIGHLISGLSKDKEFATAIYVCRKLLKIKNLFSIKPADRKTKFEKDLMSQPTGIQDEYLKKLFLIIDKFSLPFNLLTTLNYIVGTGLIINPSSPLVIWNNADSNTDVKKANGFNILVLESMTMSDLKQEIDSNSDRIKAEMEKLPKIKKPISHKDSLRIGAIISIWKDSFGRNYSEIADLLSELTEDQYKFFGSTEPIILSGKEVAIYYKRYNNDFKIQQKDS